MSRYFFDTYDGEQHLRDEEGTEFPSTRKACDEAIRILPELALDLQLQGDRWDFVSTVRDESGRSIFRAMLSLRAEWLVPNFP